MDYYCLGTSDHLNVLITNYTSHLHPCYLARLQPYSPVNNRRTPYQTTRSEIPRWRLKTSSSEILPWLSAIIGMVCRSSSEAKVEQVLYNHRQGSGTTLCCGLLWFRQTVVIIITILNLASTGIFVQLTITDHHYVIPTSSPTLLLLCTQWVHDP